MCNTSRKKEQEERECQGRGRRVVVPGTTPSDEEGAASSLDHPEYLLALVIPINLPSLFTTRLSPSFSCESIVRTRGAPWLGTGTVRGWLLVGARGLVDGVATTPEQRRRAPIHRATTGFGDRRTLLCRSCVRSFLAFPSRSPCHSLVHFSFTLYGVFHGGI